MNNLPETHVECRGCNCLQKLSEIFFVDIFRKICFRFADRSDNERDCEQRDDNGYYTREEAGINRSGESDAAEGIAIYIEPDAYGEYDDTEYDIPVNKRFLFLHSYHLPERAGMGRSEKEQGLISIRPCVSWLALI